MPASPAPFPEAPPTALSGLVEALTGLDELETLPTAEHVTRFTAVHEAMTAALASIDEV